MGKKINLVFVLPLNHSAFFSSFLYRLSFTFLRCQTKRPTCCRQWWVCHFLQSRSTTALKLLTRGVVSPQPIMADTFPFFHAFADFYTRLKMFYNGFAVLFLVLSGKSNNYWVLGFGFWVNGWWRGNRPWTGSFYNRFGARLRSWSFFLKKAHSFRRSNACAG